MAEGKFTAHAAWLRLISPLVQDLLGGLAKAGELEPPRLVLPATSRTRPVLPFEPACWPPKSGVYNEQGWIRSPGILSDLGLALTYDEVRAWVLGLTQSEAPGEDEARQIWLAAHALTAVLVELDLSEGVYREAWRRVFQKPSQGGAFRGHTLDKNTVVVGDIKTDQDGTYRCSAVCLIQRDNGLGGSLSIAGTFSRKGKTLSLVRSDRSLAQLDPSVVGVSADFVASGDHMQVVVLGKAAMRLDWENHITVYGPNRGT